MSGISRTNMYGASSHYFLNTSYVSYPYYYCVKYNTGRVPGGDSELIVYNYHRHLEIHFIKN